MNKSNPPRHLASQPPHRWLTAPYVAVTDIALASVLPSKSTPRMSRQMTVRQKRPQKMMSRNQLQRNLEASSSAANVARKVTWYTTVRSEVPLISSTNKTALVLFKLIIFLFLLCGVCCTHFIQLGSNNGTYALTSSCHHLRGNT